MKSNILNKLPLKKPGDHYLIPFLEASKGNFSQASLLNKIIIQNDPRFI